ncbi:acyl-CoA thioesterase/BAAT N-terminal domain-containing protein [Actinoplanes sp. TRM 88003]|uniref:Acyl-CoA thioesterase/BAAT N-terminal domain-containing protein n=1 Tax=Paractinoplanes aksuensis TaxID=2939490 RepID=A0ABT1DMX4_9ACTN|nr:acyl-CoA thioesterase/bile acid-CoA:amino acid N-acyltransferase family protein [Actinoplanes aksuensis]MCO8272165.1 acyl-CoA thioesterase/BAAT N-terminal domain-containing protein [Actinoplanes aksuensis]
MRKLIVVVLGCALALTGCTGDSAADAEFRVAVPEALFDAPLGVTLTGLPPGDDVTIRATTTDQDGEAWSSTGVFRADKEGRVDPAAQAPVSGDYTGAHSTGLLWSMSSENPTAFMEPTGNQPVRLTATVDGQPVAEASIERVHHGPGVIEHGVDEGFTGSYFSVDGAESPRPAVLAFGGSEGGSWAGVRTARALAAKGIPALGIGYFGEPGRPENLERIPLEYFAGALRWLAGQPGVDPKRLYVIGASRGSEAALMLGVHFPELVHGVVAASPSAVLNPGFPDETRTAWTLRGKPLPHITPAEYGFITPPKTPAAIIPVERIADPVLLLCGDADRFWGACAAAGAIAVRRGDRPTTEVRQPDAGHLVGDPVPNHPAAKDINWAEVGGSAQADALGRLGAWPQLLKFLGARP